MAIFFKDFFKSNHIIEIWSKDLWSAKSLFFLHAYFHEKARIYFFNSITHKKKVM
jgi:hypothetical protein